MKKIGYLFFTMFAMTLLLASCSEDDPQAPVVELFAEVDENDSYTVNFTTQSEHASSFSWNFGDGESGSGATISHTYTQSGEYTVTLTASGEGGDVSKTKAVTIVASMEELLSGGAAASNGKTWVMSKTASNSDGAFSFTNTPYLPAPDDVLTQFGIGTEYDNEFTFYHDGSYKIDAKNSNVLASAIHAYVNGTLVGDPIWDLGLAVESYTVPQNATFTMNEGDLTVTVRQENPSSGTVSDIEDITFEGVTWIEFSQEAYFGILTYDTKIIIRDITADRMTVSLLVSTLSPEAYPEDFMKPSIMYTLSFDKK